MFRINEQHFLAEFETHRGIAAALLKMGNLTNWEAWQRAVERTTVANKKARAGEEKPSGNLRQVLYRYGAFNGMTSSGVEQTFSLQSGLLTKYRKNCLSQTENNELKIVADIAKSEDDPNFKRVIMNAQTVWAECFGVPRKSPTLPRIDKGTIKKRSSPGEAGQNQSFVKLWVDLVVYWVFCSSDVPCVIFQV